MRLRQERRTPQQRPSRHTRNHRCPPQPRLAVAPQPGEDKKAAAQEEHLHMGEKPDEHQRAERGRVPAARPAEPGVGQHRSEDSDELELRVHARGAPVRELEVADGEQRGGDDPGKRVTAHPPGEQRERAYRAHDGWQPEQKLVHPGTRERRAQQVVERRMRVMGAQVRQEVAERHAAGHCRERLVVAEAMGTESPQAEHRTHDHCHHQRCRYAADRHASGAGGGRLNGAGRRDREGPIDRGRGRSHRTQRARAMAPYMTRPCR